MDHFGRNLIIYCGTFFDYAIAISIFIIVALLIFNWWYFVKHPSLKFGRWLPFLAVLVLVGIFDSVLTESCLQFESGFSECYYPHSFKTKIKYSGNSVTDQQSRLYTCRIGSQAIS